MRCRRSGGRLPDCRSMCSGALSITQSWAMKALKESFSLMVRRTLPAVLALLFSSPLLAGQQTLFSFVRPASVVNVLTEDAGMPQYNAEQTAEGEVLRRVVFNPAQRPTLRLSPQSGVWDWSAGQFLTLRLQSAMDWALTVDVTVHGSDGSALTSRIDLPAGPAQTVMVPLTASSPLSQGMRAGPPMPWTHDGQRLLLASSAGAVDLKQVASVSLSIPSPKVAQSLLIERVGIEDDNQAYQAAYRELIDAYGQSTRGHWPEKVANDEQLRAADSREQQQLKGWLAERGKQQLDTYGGLLAGPAFEAKGFFRTEKRDGRWFLVTPEGHPFYSLGVNAVAADGGRTYITGREGMFKALPGEGDALAAFLAKATMTTATPRHKGATSSRGAGSTSMPPTCSAPMANPARRQQTGSQPTAHRQCWMPRVGRRTRSTACRPGVSTRSATGASRPWARPGACRIPCRCRSWAITPASAPAWIGGAACPIRSTRVSPWPPSAPWPLPPAITVTTHG